MSNQIGNSASTTPAATALMQHGVRRTPHSIHFNDVSVIQFMLQ